MSTACRNPRESRMCSDRGSFPKIERLNCYIIIRRMHNQPDSHSNWDLRANGAGLKHHRNQYHGPRTTTWVFIPAHRYLGSNSILAIPRRTRRCSKAVIIRLLRIRWCKLFLTGPLVSGVHKGSGEYIPKVGDLRADFEHGLEGAKPAEISFDPCSGDGDARLITQASRAAAAAAEPHC